jgi:hypothetical protein
VKFVDVPAPRRFACSERGEAPSWSSFEAGRLTEHSSRVLKVSCADGQGSHGQMARQGVGELQAGEGFGIDFGKAETIAEFQNRACPGLRPQVGAEAGVARAAAASSPMTAHLAAQAQQAERVPGASLAQAVAGLPTSRHGLMLDRDIVVPVSRRWGRTERGFIHEFRRPLLRPMVDGPI